MILTLVLKSTSNLQDKGISNNSSNSCSAQDTINIQLSYDVNQTTEQDV